MEVLSLKRLSMLIFILVILGACSSSNPVGNDEENQTAVVEGSEEKKNVAVEKGLLNVEITLPASFFEDDDIDEVIESAKADGVSEVTKNEDGSLTYQMSKTKHKEMLKEMKESILEYVDELENSDDFPSIQEVTYKKGFKEFTLTVDKEIFENSFDGFATLGLGMIGMYYQVFEGGNLEKSKVTVHLQDASSSEIFDTVVYPDALDE